MKAIPDQRGAVSGPFRVDHECICCSVCSDVAPSHFRLANDGDGNVVCRQPETPLEVAACREAAAACPVETISEAGGQGSRW